MKLCSSFFASAVLEVLMGHQHAFHNGMKVLSCAGGFQEMLQKAAIADNNTILRSEEQERPAAAIAKHKQTLLWLCQFFR